MSEESVYILIDTGYEGDYKYQLGDNYDSFVEEYRSMYNLLSIDNYVKPGYETIVDKIMKFSNQNCLSKFGGNTKENPLFLMNTNTHSIDDIIQQARDLHYCHIWHRSPIQNKKVFIVDNTTRLIYLDLEAESG